MIILKRAACPTTAIVPGLIVARGTGPDALLSGLWTRCRTRKPFHCAITGHYCGKGTEAYRPLGNGVNRSWRIEAKTADKLLAKERAGA
jgi:hypothetical protein